MAFIQVESKGGNRMLLNADLITNIVESDGDLKVWFGDKYVTINGYYEDIQLKLRAATATDHGPRR